MVACFALLATVAGVGLAIPQFASQEPSPKSMMIIKPLPRGLTLISLSEDPGGTPYISASHFEYTGPGGDTLWLWVSLDKASVERTIRDAGEVPLKNNENDEEYLSTPLKLADGTPAALQRIPQREPAFEMLRWTKAGFDFRLQRSDPKGKSRTLVELADQMTPEVASHWVTVPRVPPGYAETKRTLSDGKVLKRKPSFSAVIVTTKGRNYWVHGYTESFTVPKGPDTVSQVMGGRSVTISPDGVSWTDQDLQFGVFQPGEMSILGQPRKPMNVDSTLRTLVAATSAGTLADWRKQAKRRLTGLEKKDTTTYRGVKIDYYAPAGEWTEDFVCVGRLTLGSCQPVNGRPDFGSLALPDGRWMVMTSTVNIRPELLDAARERNKVPGTPRLLNKDGTFDVVTIGLSELALTILPANEPFLDLYHGGRIQRPRL